MALLTKFEKYAILPTFLELQLLNIMHSQPKYNASEIRKSFIDFFINKGHTFVKSESLMPSSPNLLFTNAGMNQFVPYFLGDRPITFTRAVNSQKCIRAGGKHNDLEDVGFDTYHHTFFEMLGNWSFGDYFKKEAIEWAWELLTTVWKFPKERLYVTVYNPSPGDPDKFDQESYDLWKNILQKEGLNPNKHIINGNRKDNFWMMGDTGPCGPCTEIHIDLTEKGDTEGKLVNASSPYCIEIWNLVFIQFNAEIDGSFRPLSNKHVDTGMGFERVAGIMATTKNFTDFSNPPSNYNSDLFTDIFAKLEKLSGHMYQYTLPKNVNNLSKQERIDCSFRVLADHIRTLTFSIADGILPGNEGRNYVLRRILRRAILWGQHLQLPEGFFAELIDCVILKMNDFFPQLKSQRELIHKVIDSEEKSFERTLNRGLQLLDKIALKSQKISGHDAFTLYDTYGFPIDLTQLIAREKHLTIDLDGFNKAMEEQRERARATQKKSIITVSEDAAKQALTQFVGYEMTNLKDFETTILKIIQNEDKTYLVFDKTPFYATMGGQIGDQGTAYLEDGSQLKITDTLKDDFGHILHQLQHIPPTPNLLGKKIKVSVCENRRRNIQRNHSATHLLHWALRKHLGPHVKQAGSLVDDKKLRFDFSHYEALTQEQLEKIEREVNEAILKNSPVKWYEVPFNEKPENCIAFFGEKYGATVRVVDIGGYSIELCGGTHVSATGEIGLLKIISETAIASGTRRIEALVGLEAYNAFQNQSQTLHKISNALSCKPEEIPLRIETHFNQKTQLENELRKLQQKDIATQQEKLLKLAQEHDGIKWIIAQSNIPNTNDLRGLAINLSQTLGLASIIILVSTIEDKILTLALCSQQAIDQGYQAGKLVGDLSAQLGGKGGGKPDLAMGGAKYSGQVTETLKQFKPYLKKTEKIIH